MNLLTCVVREIVQLDGSGVLVNQITDAFQNGFSAMERTTAATTATSFQKIVLSVNPKQISNVRIIAAFRNSGLAISLMIVVTDLMNLKLNARENIENVPSPNSAVITENVFQADGDVVSI